MTGDKDENRKDKLIFLIFLLKDNCFTEFFVSMFPGKNFCFAQWKIMLPIVNAFEINLLTKEDTKYIAYNT